ncbi:MAG: peptidyl-prolyl cis-trans isomerase [Candidatus Poribacteria bacterium]|nr:peptidyl-prolyl cis-trans isomerase [Candidatus Poribacteria bacterium]
MKNLIIFAILFASLLIAVLPSMGAGIKTPQGIEDLSDLIYTTGWALVIGINEYTPAERKYAKEDADAVVNLLQVKYGFDKKSITVLKNSEATKQKIMDKIASYKEPKKVSKEDCLMIFFSGQGVTLNLPEKDEQGFLVPYNTKLDLSKEQEYEVYKQNCIGMNELKQAIKDINARHILVVADACVGGIEKWQSPAPEIAIPSYLLKVSAAGGQQIIVAGGKDEKPSESDIFKHGLLTANLFNGLKDDKTDENKDLVTTGSELASYLTKTVSDATGGKQKPMFAHSGAGEFIFAAQPFPVAVIEMDKGGKIVIQFYPLDAPNTVDNFIKLAKKGFYDGLTFHRVIAGFMAQGGDPLGSGSGGPGYKIKDEFNSRKHIAGTVAMARPPTPPDSAGSQFYICFKPQPSLDGQYTVFGQVVDGMDVVDKIQKGDKMKKVTIVDKVTLNPKKDEKN